MAKRLKRIPIIGTGHRGNTPNLPDIRPDTAENPFNDAFWKMGSDKVAYYRMGKLSITITHHPFWGWTLSIAYPNRYPTWDEVAKARYELIPDEAMMVMRLPPREEYINIHNFCFILNEFPYEAKETP